MQRINARRRLAVKILGKMVRVQTRSRLRMMKVRLPDVERTGSIRSLDEVRLLSKSRRLKKRTRKVL